MITLEMIYESESELNYVIGKVFKEIRQVADKYRWCLSDAKYEYRANGESARYNDLHEESWTLYNELVGLEERHKYLNEYLNYFKEVVTAAWKASIMMNNAVVKKEETKDNHAIDTTGMTNFAKLVFKKYDIA